MSVTVEIVGTARDLFSQPHYTFDERPGITLKDVMEQLSKFAGPDFRERIYDTATGSLNETISVFINSREARTLKGTETALNDRDKITIMPLMAGG